jgi:hypothetical protein
MFSKIKSVIIFVLITSLISSCASIGKPFTEVKHIPEGKALVYLFFTSYQDVYVQKVLAAFLVKANNKPVVDLEAGGYFPYFAEPGKLILTTKQSYRFGATGIIDPAFSPKESFTLTIEAGKTYYVEGLYEYQLFKGASERALKLRRVYDEMEAILKLEECNILPEYQTQD